MRFNLLLLFITFTIASCTLSEKEESAGAFFSELRVGLDTLGFLSFKCDSILDLFETKLPELQEWEKEEIQQHILACQASRYSREEQQENIERVFAYKNDLKEYYYGRKDSLQRLFLKEIFLRLCDQNFWDSAFVEDCYWGTSPHMVILLPQVHEVNNTAEELQIVLPVQQNITSIQKKLFKEGANAFLYEGIPFKEISRQIPTKIPLDTIAKYYSKNAEIKFETEHPQVLSYGIETKNVHQMADSIRSYYWTLETYFKSHETNFPLAFTIFNQSMEAHVDSCLLTNDMNLKRLKKAYFDSLILSRFVLDSVVALDRFVQIKDSVFNSMLEVMLNDRNKAFVDNTEKLQQLTGERFLVMKAGTSHFEEVDRLKDYKDFDLLTIQDILRERKISFIYLVPYYVWHYNL